MVTEQDEKRRAQDKKMREIYNLKVFVVGGGFQYVQMFYDAGFSGALNATDADIVCFTGGEDVYPGLYSENPHPTTRYNKQRDDYEALIYGEALAGKKTMVGICRGAQFLNVMNGGKLWQHVNNHATGAKHSVIDFRTGEEKFGMTSTHHQMMIPADDAEIIAMASLSTKKESDTKVQEVEEAQLDDAEVLWYPESYSLCFQPHPEFTQGECRDYFLDIIDEYVLPTC